MKSLFFLSMLFQINSAIAAEMVVVPSDYNLVELPLGSVVRVKQETILTGSSTSTKLVDYSFSSQGTKVFRACTLTYLPAPQRRTLPANLDLYITNITKTDSSIPTPGYCWKNGLDKTGSTLTLSVQTAKGFQADLNCYEKTAWIPPQGDACHFNEVPDVGAFSELEFWADKDSLNTIIGLPL